MGGVHQPLNVLDLFSLQVLCYAVLVMQGSAILMPCDALLVLQCNAMFTMQCYACSTLQCYAYNAVQYNANACCCLWLLKDFQDCLVT